MDMQEVEVRQTLGQLYVAQVEWNMRVVFVGAMIMPLPFFWAPPVWILSSV